MAYSRLDSLQLVRSRGSREGVLFSWLCLVLLSVSWAGKPKQDEGSDAPPVLDDVLREAGWTIPPERSSTYAAGDIYDMSTHSKVALREQCFDALPNEGEYTSAKVVQSLEASAKLRLGVVRVKGRSVRYTKRTYAEPYLSEMPLISLMLNEECAGILRRWDLTDVQVLTAVLSAEVKEESCTSLKGGVAVMWFGGDAAVSQSCDQESEGHVTVAYKALPLKDLLRSSISIDSEQSAVASNFSSNVAEEMKDHPPVESLKSQTQDDGNAGTEDEVAGQKVVSASAPAQDDQSVVTPSTPDASGRETEETGSERLTDGSRFEGPLDPQPGAALMGKADQFYYGGRGIVLDVKAAAQFYQQACEKGSVRGCLEWAHKLATGTGVVKDKERAATLVTPHRLKAADSECRLSFFDAGGWVCSRLGWIYDHGLGVARDEERAMDLYLHACDSGTGSGCTDLGLLYNRRGVRGYTEAAEFYDRACERTHEPDVRGCYFLGLLYANGYGVDGDPRRAVQLAERACDEGLQQACEHLPTLRVLRAMHDR